MEILVSNIGYIFKMKRRRKNHNLSAYKFETTLKFEQQLIEKIMFYLFKNFFVTKYHLYAWVVLWPINYLVRSPEPSAV